jgi:hypothetical protein
MKIKKNGKVITLSESDLRKITKRVINEQWDILNDLSSWFFDQKTKPFKELLEDNLGRSLTEDEINTIKQLISDNGLDSDKVKKYIRNILINQ